MKHLFKRFSDLSGRTLRTVGTCISADFGECSIQYPGGFLARVKGTGTVEQRYFVLGWALGRGGAESGEFGGGGVAPSMARDQVDVSFNSSRRSMRSTRAAR